ncbi:MAG TPA: hypothetical protein VK000_05070 [Luteimonas sp.]|nr:hypothetical protein [Luteimonas sp.]
MDTHSFSGGGRDAAVFSPIGDADHESLQTFRDLLHRCLPIDDDARFWECLGRGIAAIERGMAPEAITRFEYAIDHELLLHGLDGWTAKRPRSVAVASDA